MGGFNVAFSGVSKFCFKSRSKIHFFSGISYTFDIHTSPPPRGATAPSEPSPPHCRGFTMTDTPQSVGLLWISDQPVAETSTWQHTTDRHPCPRWESNPQSQPASCHRPTPLTARVPAPAIMTYCRTKFTPEQLPAATYFICWTSALLRSMNVSTVPFIVCTFYHIPVSVPSS